MKSRLTKAKTSKKAIRHQLKKSKKHTYYEIKAFVNYLLFLEAKANKKQAKKQESKSN
jgi:hypothetical protein